jgi:pyruvate formate lyase activating enzyme
MELIRAAEIGRDAGLNFVYTGNMPGRAGSWENTQCPRCHALLIERHGYTIYKNHLNGSGKCPQCNEFIPGLW